MCLPQGRYFYKLGIYKFTEGQIKNVVQHEEENIAVMEITNNSYKIRLCKITMKVWNAEEFYWEYISKSLNQSHFRCSLSHK